MVEHSVGAKEKPMQVSETMRAEERGSCSCWVVEMEKLLEDTKPWMETARWNQRSIHWVPEFIKDMTNSKAYTPQFVSLGPYHHGEPHLLPMEEHKRRAVLHRVERARKPLKEFIAAIEEVADELEGAYDDLDDKWRGANRGSFVEMMVMDGCFLLELIRTDREVENDYAGNDPVFGEDGMLRLWSLVMLKDMIAMENQLPLVVLQKLSAVQPGTSPSAGDINEWVLRLLDRPPLEEGMDILGLHFLDLYHKSYCGSYPRWEGSDDNEPRTPCAVELSEAGIQFKKSDTDSIHDVDFKNGVLSMPLFLFHDSTEIILLNLMAFELLHPDAKGNLGSYISFVDKIVESERDVALLRSEGLFENLMGSDRKVVEMFNTLTKLALSNPSSKLGHVKREVNTHCSKRRNKWPASFVNTYLSNPWVFISLVAAFILLVATLLQTVYTVVPFYTKG